MTSLARELRESLVHNQLDSFGDALASGVGAQDAAGFGYHHRGDRRVVRPGAGTRGHWWQDPRCGRWRISAAVRTAERHDESAAISPSCAHAVQSRAAGQQNHLRGGREIAMPVSPPDVSHSVSEYLADTRATARSTSPPSRFESLVRELQRAYVEARQVFIIGNGGSASTASHFACDLAKTILGRPINRRGEALQGDVPGRQHVADHRLGAMTSASTTSSRSSYECSDSRATCW